MSFPSAMLLSHLAVLGRWCPGWAPGTEHAADDLTARTGRVLCRSCSDTVSSLRRSTHDDV